MLFVTQSELQLETYMTSGVFRVPSHRLSDCYSYLNLTEFEHQMLSMVFSWWFPNLRLPQTQSCDLACCMGLFFVLHTDTLTWHHVVARWQLWHLQS